jgi:hypothetical protein
MSSKDTEEMEVIKETEEIELIENKAREDEIREKVNKLNEESKRNIFNTFKHIRAKKYKTNIDRSGPIQKRCIVQETCDQLDSDDYIDDIDSVGTKNGWTKKKKEIIENWLEDLYNISFVYEKKLQYTKQMANATSFSILFLTTISSYFSLSQLNIDEEAESALYVRWALLTINCSAAFISGASKICNYENKIEILSKYKQKLDEIESVFLTEITIPSNLRKNADDFLRTHSVNMQKVMTEYPEITDKEYMKYTQSYIEHLYKNMELNEHKNRIKKHNHEDEYYNNSRTSPDARKRYSYDPEYDGDSDEY